MPAPQGWTYFASDGELVKIGFSAKPNRRLRQIECDLGRAIEPLAIVPDGIAGEYETHKRFAHLRVRGEWFRPESDLLAFIEEMKVAAEPTPPPPPPPPEEDPIISRFHGLRIRHAGNKAITVRLSNAIGALETLKKPEGRPWHHQQTKMMLARTLRELQPLLSALSKGEG
jgi:hypothetical protein